MCSDEVLVERPLLNSPLNGPRTFQTIDTADLAKARGGREPEEMGTIYYLSERNGVSDLSHSFLER